LWTAGTFAAVKIGRDVSNSHLFAIKYNNSDDESVIEAIESEARLLARMGTHSNVIKMYGAVLDHQKHEFLPAVVYKVMLEYSPGELVMAVACFQCLL
jgi:serine/threonine protein kinase